MLLCKYWSSLSIDSRNIRMVTFSPLTSRMTFVMVKEAGGINNISLSFGKQLMELTKTPIYSEQIKYYNYYSNFIVYNKTELTS
jgi:hypothetical protein